MRKVAGLFLSFGLLVSLGFLFTGRLFAPANPSSNVSITCGAQLAAEAEVMLCEQTVFPCVALPSPPYSPMRTKICPTTPCGAGNKTGKTTCIAVDPVYGAFKPWAADIIHTNWPTSNPSATTTQFATSVLAYTDTLVNTANNSKSKLSVTK